MQYQHNLRRQPPPPPLLLRSCFSSVSVTKKTKVDCKGMCCFCIVGRVKLFQGLSTVSPVEKRALTGDPDEIYLQSRFTLTPVFQQVRIVFHFCAQSIVNAFSQTT